VAHLLVRHRVSNYKDWKRVFDSHSGAQQKAGLHIQKIFRNVDKPDEIFLLFDAETLEGARGFVSAPNVSNAQETSGVLDEPDIFFLSHVGP